MLALAQQLRHDGVDAELDQFHQHELIQWPRWCEEQLRPENSDFVLCVCTETYKQRIEGKVAADTGKGVFWEGTLVYNYLYDDKRNSRFVPVYLADTEERARDEPRESIMQFYQEMARVVAQSASQAGTRAIENRAGRAAHLASVSYEEALRGRRVRP